MKARENVLEIQPAAYKAMLQLEEFVKSTGIPVTILDLIKIRASQLNKCGYCISLHTKGARQKGETEERIYLLNAWKYSKAFTDEEKAALALTEELTFVSEKGLGDTTYQRCIDLFGKIMTANLIMAIVTINSWNRIMVASES
jgi:AhpD family alkylhydroperoxidase